MSQVYSLEYGGYRAEISATGAGLRKLERDLAGQAWALTEPWPAGVGTTGPAEPPLSAGLVLAPWPNRVTNGTFDFAGTAHQLDITEPAHHAAIHGLVSRSEWQVTEHVSNRVSQRTAVGIQPGWPYPLQLSVTHELCATGLVVTHTAHNTGIVPAPFGLGIHTFLRAGDAGIDDCTLEFPASVRLRLDSALTPEGPPVPVEGTPYDFTSPRRLQGVWLDSPFSAILSDLDGRARAVLRGPEGPPTTLWVEPKFRWMQVFTADPGHGQAFPGRGRALAVEPMTCPPDALNSGIDLIVLNPGETWSASWGLG